MEEKKSYIAAQVELLARYWPGRNRSLRRVVRMLLPDLKTVLTTLLIVGIILSVQQVGATPSSPPATPNSSTTTISYQGRLADSNANPITGTVAIQFRLYNTNTGGSPLWNETQAAVPVENGLFHVLLGSTTPIPISVLSANSTLWLGIQVGGDSEMSPREQIASVPYAMVASSVLDGSITTSKILDGAVTASKLAPGVINIPDGSITTAKLADGAVTPNKASGFVTTDGSNLLVQYGFRTPLPVLMTTITFSRPFSAAPSVIATVDTAGGQNVTVRDISPTGFTAVVSDLNQGPALNWVAIGPP